MDVKAVREAAGKSQRELADWLKVPQSTVARFERGVSEPSDEQARWLEALSRRSNVVVGLDSYPSAPRGGKPESRAAQERLAWMNARNRAIQAGVRSAPSDG
jgi:transcriptional regulator with XRE-family HTH domain